ncbi:MULTISPECIES: hypothetical protein [Methylobacillus]|uniref:Lipoprotein n=1 Tax=Methylobacillus flagellatus (strain ATCC 51484 / DSM 6875 / VKM B-1610 / KT) TaxID=265072 RepID=Q1H2I5_METFK|nr:MULTISPECIES: hypothetical protein [Methylobacillus]ABE49158.1 hypothetical protein Mfla_0890 [Methylobacillus flagellatus KT]ABE49302.1 hypothetical protein Mfla_1034 [Methylobacillus flagellatus KT]MPS49803.1 hypothetical protein [Methylobacillus sp.]
MKKRVIGLVALLFASCLAHAEGPQPASKVAVYISPYEYTNEIKLWHFMKDYWFAQGPLIEPVLTKTLSARLGDTVMCEAGVTANVLLWVRPKMFYNPHMRNFYGTINATIYTGSGRAIASYTGESRLSGDLDILPANTVQATYDLAIQQVADKIKADPVITRLIDEGLPDSESYTPCAMIAILPGLKKP